MTFGGDFKPERKEIKLPFPQFAGHDTNLDIPTYARRANAAYDTAIKGGPGALSPEQIKVIQSYSNLGTAPIKPDPSPQNSPVKNPAPYEGPSHATPVSDRTKSSSPSSEDQGGLWSGIKRRISSVKDRANVALHDFVTGDAVTRLERSANASSTVSPEQRADAFRYTQAGLDNQKRRDDLAMAEVDRKRQEVEMARQDSHKDLRASMQGRSWLGKVPGVVSMAWDNLKADLQHRREVKADNPRTIAAFRNARAAKVAAGEHLLAQQGANDTEPEVPGGRAIRRVNRGQSQPSIPNIEDENANAIADATGMDVNVGSSERFRRLQDASLRRTQINTGVRTAVGALNPLKAAASAVGLGKFRTQI